MKLKQLFFCFAARKQNYAYIWKVQKPLLEGEFQIQVTKQNAFMWAQQIWEMTIQHHANFYLVECFITKILKYIWWKAINEKFF